MDADRIHKETAVLQNDDKETEKSSSSNGLKNVPAKGRKRPVPLFYLSVACCFYCSASGKLQKKGEIMIAPAQILAAWKKFDGLPMETLTKAWFYHQLSGKRQRDVHLMKEHRSRYGLSGNCFDLALWVLDEFEKDGIAAYPIGHKLGTEEAHAAVIAEDTDGRRFLCDLGDQWLQPVLIESADESFTKERVAGFFPAADIRIVPVKPNKIEIRYYRPNGKMSKQQYETDPVKLADFWEAADFSQSHVDPKPLFEIRLPYRNETAHWEFYDWNSVLSTNQGLFEDPPAETAEDWAERIAAKSGGDKRFIKEALTLFKEMND